jgi:hypothetical protein
VKRPDWLRRNSGKREPPSDAPFNMQLGERDMKFNDNEHRELVAMRIAAGKLIDPETAEITWRVHVRSI